MTITLAFKLLLDTEDSNNHPNSAIIPSDKGWMPFGNNNNSPQLPLKNIHLPFYIGHNVSLPIYEIDSVLQLDHTIEQEKAVSEVYKYLHYGVNRLISANGASAYGEITRHAVTQLFTILSRHNWMNDSDGLGTSTITMTDLGAGYMVPLAHLAQKFPNTTVVGVENCPLRSYGYAAGMKALLSSNASLTNSKICYVNCDIWQLKDLEWCKILYMFDEAFTTELVMYIYHLFMSSKNTKYLITFKAGKKSAGNKYLLDGFLNPKDVRLVESVLVKKNGCMEKSWVSFYEKVPGAVVKNLPSKSCKPEEFQDATEYNATDMMKIIDLFADDVKGAHAQLFQETEDGLNTTRASKRCKVEKE